MATLSQMNGLNERADTPYVSPPASSRPVDAATTPQYGESSEIEEITPASSLNQKNLWLDDDGAVILTAPDGSDSRPVSKLTRETFAAPNLDELARRIRESQAAGEFDPVEPSQQLWVDRDGNVEMGDQEDKTRLSKLTQETFASTTTDRLQRERRIVSAKLPRNARQMSDGTYDGWLYRIVNEFGDAYELFLWYDVSCRQYKVSLVSPRMEGTVDGHGCHLFTSGTLCLRPGGEGYEDMTQAYARSVLWTKGASCYRRGHGFQFNLGQTG